jgi:hypothetical protein
MAHANLVTPSELPRYGVPGPFIQQFIPRAVQVKISTAGALGTMAIQHRLAGEANYDPTPIVSSAGSTWDLDLTGVGKWLTLTFAVGAYVTTSVYTIAEDGTVTRSGAGIDTITASRYDLRSNGCAVATAEALALMKDGVTLPVTGWGADVRRHCAAIVHEFLRSSVGMTAEGAGVGDANVITWAAAARAYFSDIGKSGIAPPDLVDSRIANYGPIWRDPQSDEPRGY